MLFEAERVSTVKVDAALDILIVTAPAGVSLGGGGTHAPAAQTAPVAQRTLHPPQLVALVLVSTHAAPQRAPVAQLARM